MSESIAIVGGGPAGMALALALNHHGMNARILDARPRGAARQDKRILALSHGSRQILEWLGVWPSIAATRIDAIHVSQQGGFGRTWLTATEAGVPALGYVAAAASVSTALDEALAQTPIVFHENTRVLSAEASGDAIHLSTSTGVSAASLAVYAEGSVDHDSAVVVHDYGQSAVICHATAAGLQSSPRRAAYERFTPQGPLALLPFGEGLAVVYTCPAKAAEALAGLSDAEFLLRLQAHFGSRLRFTTVTPRLVFPLAMRYRRTPVGDHCVWLGNAAQTLHPVAGQGFNLALRDVWELARTLATASDPGSTETLARYAAARGLDRRSTIGFTDALVRIFSNDDPLLRLVRGFGLLAIDQLPPLRSFVAKRMMYGARAWP
ncbi:MAG: 2-octaprenyl-6-methoxyphenyl hydroxylase [Rhodocyclaceae bacterium]|nr:MAG: 2-octaprenyl-6-methoxyphenyl hydroxylase [Rhodocyclaceae bacterium]